ncbi:type VII secretion protein EccCa [Nocardioides sp. W7]|uniref:type VII secretion protein EccCa n=1 Tax=Nocardioides sp. W7 TaxID=2931390 RepID=UPI001FCFC660|nr:type VII secretion protein EccCa [Nocardioides sp. W7]
MEPTLTRTVPGRPEPPSGRLVLRAPPELEPHEGASGVLMNAIPMLGGLGSVVLVTTMGGSSGGRGYLAAGMFLFATLGFVVVQIDRQRTQRARSLTAARTAYLHHLAQARRLAREAAGRQRRALVWHHPEPAALPALAQERSRLWRHRSTDERFLRVRYGLSAQPLALELVPPEDAHGHADPAAVSALHRLLAAHRLQPDLPASVDLRAFARLQVCGPEEPARSLARALLCSATASHSPEHLVVAVLASERRLAHWDWVKWLPHAASARRYDAVGPRRMVSTSLTELATLLPDLEDRPRFGADERRPGPHVLLVVDGAELPSGNPVVPPDGLQGVTVLDLPTRGDAPGDATGVRLLLEDGDRYDDRPRLTAIRMREEPVRARADQCDLATAEAFARRLAPLRTAAQLAAGDGRSGAATGPADLLELLALGDVQRFDPTAAWRERPVRDRLRVPIGLGADGSVVHLDLKESAQQGMGPHGLVIGATGSGKSEFLRTLVLGLTMTHSPDQLNLVLVDFKGGATFAGMARLPHVSAVITNLAQELTLVDRMQDALSGELVRRQELLRAAGNLASVRDYERARTDGADLAPLPSLFIVVDEFSELLSAKPELVDLFVAIGRLGRSLGLHLLLASQRLEEGRLRGLESHLSYRVGLRTFSAQESRVVLGVPDAYELPSVPGVGYLRSDPTTMVRFQSAYVSGPAPGLRRRGPDDRVPVPGILPFTIAEVPTLGVPEPERLAPEQVEQVSLLDAAVAAMVGRGPAAHQVWLPPLDVPEPLDRLLGDLAPDPDLGLISRRWRRRGGLRVPLGVVDRPREQRRDVLDIDLGGAAGHVAVVGGPRSGKSTLLRTIVTSTSLTTTPLEAQFFVLDFGGGTFAPLTRLPHVAGVGTRAEPDVVRRVLAEVQGVVDRREAYFRDQGIDSIETYRTRRRESRLDDGPDDGWGDVFLVVDGWSTLRADFDDLETQVQQLATRGLAFGLHVVSGASRWADFRATMRDVFGTRLELRLGEAQDSEVDRRAAALVPAGRPGRGLVAGPLHVLTGLPRIDGVAETDSLGAGVDDLVARVREAWRGPDGPKLRLLPERIDLDRVRELAGVPTGDDRAGRPDRADGRLLLGVDERELAPVWLDPDTAPHLWVLGDGGSGKSSVLRSHVREVMRTRTPKQAQLVVVDYRRSLLGEVGEEYLLDYLTSAAQAGPALQDLASYLHDRLPGPDVTSGQLRHRSWWSGAEVFVVVDDYDLVATQHASPVHALQPLLAQGRDTGLHLALARRTGGASRALHDPVVQSLRDLAAPGLLLSGPPEEGPLIGNLRPVPAPPGRGRLVTRERGIEVVQTAWTDPTP